MTESRELEQFLEKVGKEQKRRCACCSVPRLAAAIEAFLDKKMSGESRLSLHWMHHNFFSTEKMGGPRAYSALVNHVKRCLRRDPATGARLEEESE